MEDFSKATPFEQYTRLCTSMLLLDQTGVKDVAGHIPQRAADIAATIMLNGTEAEIRFVQQQQAFWKVMAKKHPPPRKDTKEGQ